MKLCYALTASFCTIESSLATLRTLAERGDELIPVVSANLAAIDTRFGRAADILWSIEKICNKTPISSIVGAEPIGPVLAPELMIIAPCTGNTLGKIAHGISDGPVTLAAKSHLRGGRPLLIALCSNDALSGNFRNLAALYQRKNVYFVPMRQDDVKNKPASLVADLGRLIETIDAAMEGRQVLPLFE